MRLVCGCVYAGAGMGESTTDLVYGGHDLITENGAVLAEARPFSSGCAVSEIDVGKLADERRRLGAFPACGDGYTVVPFRAALTQTVLTRTVERNPFVPDSEDLRRQRCEDIFTIQAHGLKKRLAHTRSKKGRAGHLRRAGQLPRPARLRKDDGPDGAAAHRRRRRGHARFRFDKADAHKRADSL